MKTINRQISKQAETLLVFALALSAVLLYTLWGASILRAEQQANAQTGSALSVNL